VNIDTRIYGYVGDGFVACNACAEEIALDYARTQRDDEPDEAELSDYEGAELRPLHSHDDQTACGERCDCGAEVFEEADEHGLDEACRDCGYEVPALWAVVTDDARRIVLARFKSENLAEDDVWERANDRELHPEPHEARVVETEDELYPGVGGRIPLPGEVALPGLSPYA
jgi:hypothetical protein